MQVKTFIGASTQEVMAQIKNELGSEAVILDSKNFQENGQKKVRMTAALDRIEPAVNTSSVKPTVAAASYSAAAANAQGAYTLHNLGKNAGQQGWSEEWQGIKRHLFSLMKPALRLDKLEPKQRGAIEFLESNGVNDQALLELYRRIFDAPSRSVLEPLSEMMPVKPWGFEEWPERVHLVAGPFGSGKTTTVVRMALALQKARQGSRICIVNADAERGNGRLLLKHYAGLSDLVYREVSNAMEMAGVIAEINTQGFDKVIVDLPGLAKNQHLGEVLASLALDRIESVAVALHLVFSPYYAPEMQSGFLGRYNLPMPASLIWSKLDECSMYGSMLNLAVASALPVSSLSFGPGLLNTLVPAKQPALWRLLFKRELPAAGGGLYD